MLKSIFQKKFLDKIKRTIQNIVGKTREVICQDVELIRDLKYKYLHVERRLYYGNNRYLVDTLYCHAAPGTLESSVLRLQSLLESHRGHNKLLNLGGGTGQVSRILQDIGFDVVNVDIEISDKNGKNIRHDLNSDSKLPVDSESFDFVLCQEVLEHVENPWKLLRLANCVLRENGILVLTTPNILSHRSKRMFMTTGYFRWFTPDCLEYHINPLPLWEIELIAKRTGFILREVYGNGEYYIGRETPHTPSEIIDNNEILILVMEKSNSAAKTGAKENS